MTLQRIRWKPKMGVEMVDMSMEYEDCVLPSEEATYTIALDGDPKTWPLRERPLIYVAGYFSANPMHGTANAVGVFDVLLDAGWLPLVPHVSLLLDILSPRTPEFWYEYDLGLLMRCDAMYVCPDSLTARSVGVGKEIEFCERHGIPIFYEIVDAKERYDD